MGEEDELTAFIAWKKAYIDALIKKLQPKGAVLQVGFGIGHAAQRIQEQNPESHVIIEKDRREAGLAREWAKGRAGVTVIEGHWKEALGKLGKFDTVLYNDYPFINELEITRRYTPEETASTAKEAKELLSSLEEQISGMAVNYSDKEIDDFFETIGKNRVEELPVFFDNLKKFGFITEEQHKKIREKIASASPETAPASEPSAETVGEALEFIEACLDKHAAGGSRISCYATDAKSKTEDPLFFKRIVTNPDLKFEEDLISIDIPDCDFSDALLLLIEKS